MSDENFRRVHSAEMVERAEAIAERRRRAFHKISAKGLAVADTGLPSQFRPVPRVQVYTDGEQVVVTAWPGDIVPEPDDQEWHNCDAMGCGREHVVAIAQVREPWAVAEQRDAALRDLDAMRAELSRERRRVRQLRRAVLFFSGGCALYHEPACIGRTTAERLLARARDRSHDDE